MLFLDTLSHKHFRGFTCGPFIPFVNFDVLFWRSPAIEKASLEQDAQSVAARLARLNLSKGAVNPGKLTPSPTRVMVEYNRLIV